MVDQNDVWSDWSTIKTVSQKVSEWTEETIPLSEYAERRIRIAFYHTDSTESSHCESTGWYIDDVEIVATDRPPDFPTNPLPQPNNPNTGLNVILSWECSDPDPSDTLTYDVYFGTLDPPQLISQDQVETEYYPGILECNTEYYWRIVARDNYGAETVGDVWSFTTKSCGIIRMEKGWNLVSYEVNKCFYEKEIPVIDMIDPDKVEFEEKESLFDWLLDDANSPIRDAEDFDKAGNWQRIISFDQDGAHLMDKDLPKPINSLHYLSVGYGYWIKMSEPGLLIVNGKVLDRYTILRLKEGWNLMGYITPHVCYGKDKYEKEEICPYEKGIYNPESVLYCPLKEFMEIGFASIAGKFERIISYDTCNGAMVYDANIPEFAHTFHYIGPKYGYWIKMKEEGEFAVFPVPVADAGPDQNVFTGSVVILDGSGSGDPDGFPITCQWSLISKPGGSASVLNGSTTMNPSFVPDMEGAYEVSLVVHNGYNYSMENTVVFKAQKFRFSYLPPYPTHSGDYLEGKIEGVAPSDCCVAVYIKVGDNWWTKPTYESPLTSINEDGTWKCNIVTGGYDEYASSVAAFLLPVGSEAPICGPCSKLPNIPEAIAFYQEDRIQTRFISFAGYEWKVKRTDFPYGPGPNYFSDIEEDVWVDEEGLHLTISEHDGIWFCTEVILDASLGYGTYIFQTQGRIDLIDPMMVLGLFTWDGGAEAQHYREMDIEFARWGNPDESTNAQFVVQPCNQCPGCSDRCTRFSVDLSDENSDLTHYLVWNPGIVQFRTYYGKYSDNPPPDALVNKWIYAGEHVPVPGSENIRFNFWLLRGDPPMDGQGDEVVITDFIWEEDTISWPLERIVTNIPYYPITGYYGGVEGVLVNEMPVTLDRYYGLRYDVELEDGPNFFDIGIIKDGLVYETSRIEIDYDSSLSTEDHTLLYSSGDPYNNETIIIDLDSDCILGVLYGVKIVSATHDGRFVVDSRGNLYQTSNHKTVGLTLPFSYSTVYPVFSSDDSFCYAGREKVIFPDMTVVSRQLPVGIDGRFATFVPEKNLLVQGSSGSFNTMDITNDELVSSVSFSKRRVNWGCSAADPNGRIGIVTSFSWATGAIDIVDLQTGGFLARFDSLTDYIGYSGQIAFSKDGRFAMVGSHGNSYYHYGRVYVIDLATYKIVSTYSQYGASSIAIDPNGLVYVSSSIATNNGEKGSRARRGINVFELDDEGKLHYIKNFYLNYRQVNPHNYNTPNFFIKKGIE